MKKHNLSPHWTSTGSPQENRSALPLETEGMQHHEASSTDQEGTAHRIPVRRGMGMPKWVSATLGISISITGSLFLGYLFLEGVGSLQANITGEMIPDHVIQLFDKGFVDVSVSAGELLEFRNTLETVEQYRSEIPSEKTGVPLIATPTIPPGETVRLRVPSEAAGKDVLLISGFDPSRRGMMRVGVRAGAGSFSSSEGDPPFDGAQGRQRDDRVEKQEKEKEEEMDIPSTPTTPMAPSTILPVNTQPEVLNLGLGTAQNMIAAVWPANLRTNRYTIGSPFVPDLSPIVAVRFGGKSHGTAKDQASATGTFNGVHHAPDTGPSLWVLVALSFCIVPVYFVRRNVR